MARTRIQILAEQVGINANWIKINQDNVNQYLKQLDYKVSIEGLLSGQTKIVRAPIIKGDGVNGELAGIYPGLDTADSYTNALQKTVYNIAAGNLSEIFTYLNAGGSNVKYTKLIYSNINQNFVDSEFNSDRFYRNPYNTSQYVMDIYWGKYIEFYFVSPVNDTHHAFMEGERNFQVIEGLSGEIDISYKNFFSNPDAYLNDESPADYTIASIDLDQKRITGIPANNSSHEGSYNSWVIETDDFEYTSTANPDTNTDTNTDTETDTSASQTGGIKISELDKITSFDPADLMIISRDEDNNGTYDKSFAIDPTLLRDSARSNIGTEKPSDPKNGEFWFDENTANLYIYTEALNSWIQI